VKFSTFCLCNGVVLVVYIAFLVCLFAYNERKWREFQRQSTIIAIHYGI